MTHGFGLGRSRDDRIMPIGGDDRDPRVVTRYELLAETMPSVLARLRPIDATSDGILRYFGTRDSEVTRLDAARRGRS